MLLNNLFYRGEEVLVMDRASDFMLKKISYLKIRNVPKNRFNINTWNNDVLNNKQLLSYAKKHKLKAVVPLTMDFELDYYLGQLLSGHKTGVRKSNKIICLFSEISTMELSVFCRYNGISLRPDRTNTILEDIEKVYPGTLHSFHKAITINTQLNQK